MSRKGGGSDEFGDDRHQSDSGPDRNYYHDSSKEFRSRNMPSGLHGRLKEPPVLPAFPEGSYAAQLDDLIFIAYIVCMMTTIGIAFLVVGTGVILMLTYL